MRDKAGEIFYHCQIKSSIFCNVLNTRVISSKTMKCVVFLCGLTAVSGFVAPPNKNDKSDELLRQEAERISKYRPRERADRIYDLLIGKKYADEKATTHEKNLENFESERWVIASRSAIEEFEERYARYSDISYENVPHTRKIGTSERARRIRELTWKWMLNDKVASTRSGVKQLLGQLVSQKEFPNTKEDLATCIADIYSVLSQALHGTIFQSVPGPPKLENIKISPAWKSVIYVLLKVVFDVKTEQENEESRKTRNAPA